MFAPIHDLRHLQSLGCTLYALAYLHSPFETLATTEQGGSIAMAVMNAQYKHPANSAYSQGLRDLIDSMLKPDPSQRPDIHQVRTEFCLVRYTSAETKCRFWNRWTVFCVLLIDLIDFVSYVLILICLNLCYYGPFFIFVECQSKQKCTELKVRKESKKG